MAKENLNQYPHVRALRHCLACGRAKDPGLLVCWPCHNEFKVQHDIGYGVDMERVLRLANEQIERRNQEHLR